MGARWREEVATTLAHNGVTIVSGLARGVDSIAHQAAVNAGGRTLAVLGNGVDLVYPPENRRLADQDHGAGCPGQRLCHSALRRMGSTSHPATASSRVSRWRSSSSRPDETSGALITASFAAEQGRDVFAVPGNINAPQSQGTNRLIRDGAQPLLNPQDVLEALNLTMVTEHRARAGGLTIRPG